MKLCHGNSVYFNLLGAAALLSHGGEYTSLSSRRIPHSMPRIFKHSLLALVFLLTSGLGAICFWGLPSGFPDPVVQDRRMSLWVSSLLDQSTNFYKPYGYSREHRRVFSEHREHAIPHLILAIRYPTRYDRARIRLSHSFSGPLARVVRPENRRPRNRWLGVLALADLARFEPDPRIPGFLLSCMREKDENLRKICAYEAGPWLEPGRHITAVKILELALKDEAHPVRRDACRRISESSGKDPSFAAAVERLAALLEEIGRKDPVLDVQHHAKNALQRMRAATDRQNPPLRL